MQESHILRVAVCEDNNEDAQRLIGIIKESAVSLDMMPAEIECFSSGVVFLKDFDSKRYDLIFMDIVMKGLSGIETVKAIREKDPFTVVAFTTSSPDFTRESYNLGALKYIDKPVNAASVRESLELALMKKKSRPSIAIIESGGNQSVIYNDDIMYLEQVRYVINVHLRNAQLNQRIITTARTMRMNDIEKQLPSPPFLRCHQSFLINFDYVIKIDKNIPAFIMKDGNLAFIRQRDSNKCAEYEKKMFDWQLKKLGG